MSGVVQHDLTLAASVTAIPSGYLAHDCVLLLYDRRESGRTTRRER
jgi:hypothetical protein